MLINDSIRFFRKNNKQTQKEITSASNASISRFEKNKQSIDLKEFIAVLDKLSVTPEEVFLFSTINNEQQKYEDLYTYCSKHLENQQKKQQLLTYYSKLQKKYDLTLREFSNVISIKFFFSKHWIEIEQISEKDLKKGYEHLINRNYYTHYDYCLLLKICTLLDYNKANNLIRKAIPIKDLDKRTDSTKFYAYNTLRNMITTRLYDGDLYNAQKFVNYAKLQFKHSNDYKFKLHIQFLEYLVLYVEKNDLDIYTKIITILKIVQDMDDIAEYTSMRNDIDIILEKKYTLNNFKDFPISHDT